MTFEGSGKPGGSEIKCAHQLIVYFDGINVLVGSVHTIKKSTEALVVASKETGLEVNADESKYMIMSRDQSTGQNPNIRTDSRSLKRRNS